MATLLLGGAGSLVGGALFGPVGALAGRALGALGGAVVDATLMGGSRSRVSTGPRLSDLDVMTSNAGAPLPRLYGRARLSGEVIWATRLEEVVSTQVQSTSGGKSSRTSATRTTSITYSYYASFAVALCEGPVSRIGRIWADGKVIDRTAVTVRAHLGTADQMPDPWIAAKQGGAGAPAYRGVAYVVFERLPLAKYGNRVPQITVEVERAVGALEQQVRAVTLIPGATEFGYQPSEVMRVSGAGAYESENRHSANASSDFEAALDQLMAACPNLERVSLVVAWFGDDLRAGQCTIRPKVDLVAKTTTPSSWMVSGLPRLLAQATSRFEGRAAYGGTPADASVVAAIQALKARGLKVTLNPFIMMDIPPGSGREDPWTGASQPAYPWRGRITCHPAPGRPGSPDGTGSAATQVAQLFGAAQPGHFYAYAGLILYAGPAEWSLRRMVLHYAHLAALAGGVEAILIGSELAALTRVRGAGGSFPAAQALATLAADVKGIVGAGTLVSYAADWTEYGAQTFADGSLAFPLDGLWAAPSIDFVGIDYYPPLTDWRDGSAHLDAAEAASIYDAAFLKRRLRGGEAFDWYYADDDARTAQARLPISDGAFGEPWVYRQKDVWSWWANAHHARSGGARSATPTAWVPKSKPLRFMETGCPAVDKGTNRPSVFPDTKSDAGGYPPFSRGRRDDAIQRRMIEAVVATFDPSAGADATDNPVSPVYGGRMVEAGTVFLWTWDARPYPEFPLSTSVWADGANWATGHWLTGRLGSAPLCNLLAALCADHGVTDMDATGVTGVVDGYVVDSPMSARDAIEPLARAFAFEASEAEGRVVFAARGAAPVVQITDGDLVAEEDNAPLRLVRTQESELPLEVGISFTDAGSDYRTASVGSRRLAGGSRHVARAQLPVVSNIATMGRAADVWLQDLWAGRETASFSLPPSYLGLTAGDVISLTSGGRTRLMEITRIEDAEARAVTARSIEPEVFDLSARDTDAGRITLPTVYGPPEVQLLDLPLLETADPVPLLHIAAFASPWPGSLVVWRSADGASFEAVAGIGAPAILGTTLSDLPCGPLWRFDTSTTLQVQVEGGTLSGTSEALLFDGANLAVLVAEGRGPEVLQFRDAELLESGIYVLSGLLRGQAGTEAEAAVPWPAGTRLVMLDRNIAVGASGTSAYGRPFIYRVGRADRDHGDPGVTQVSATVGGRALTPLSPVHLSARRIGSDIALSWVRRTRTDGSWDLAEAPLEEAVEAYRVEILDGGAVKRAFDVTSPSANYPAAAELADFGSARTSLTFRVAQLSSVVGAGTFATATCAL